jgi:hypothetical protein
MLTTSNNQSLGFRYDRTSDGTVFLNPGVTMVNNYIMDFRGGYKTFSQMTDFTTGSNKYQYSVLCLQDSGDHFPDMTSIAFSPVDTTAALVSPGVDSTFVKPLGLFLFYTDGVSVTLSSAARIQ